MDEPPVESVEEATSPGCTHLWTATSIVLAVALLFSVMAAAAWFGASLGSRPGVAVSTWTPIPRPSVLVTFTPTSGAPPGTPTPRLRPTRLAATATVAPTVTATPRLHIIRAGETLLSIAEQYRVRYDELLALNQIQDPNRIFIGQTLLLPPSLPTPPPGSLEHTVQPGETLLQIAVRYGVSMAAVMEANGLANPDTLLVGQRLIIPPPQTPTPAN